MFFIFIILIGSSFLQSYTPYYFKKILDKLEHKKDDAYLYIIIYCLAFRTGTIFLKNLQDLLFAPFASFCECETGLMLFKHLMNLSLNFHINRETGKILRVVSRGCASFGEMTRMILLTFMPLIFLLIFY